MIRLLYIIGTIITYLSFLIPNLNGPRTVLILFSFIGMISTLPFILVLFYNAALWLIALIAIFTIIAMFIVFVIGHWAYEQLSILDNHR